MCYTFKEKLKIIHSALRPLSSQIREVRSKRILATLKITQNIFSLAHWLWSENPGNAGLERRASNCDFRPACCHRQLPPLRILLEVRGTSLTIGGKNERKTELFYHHKKKKKKKKKKKSMQWPPCWPDDAHAKSHSHSAAQVMSGNVECVPVKNTTFPIDFSFGGSLCTITSTLSQNVIQVFLLCEIYQAK